MQWLEAFKIATEQEPRIFIGADIVAQVSPAVREKSFLERPSDVRLLMVTSDEGARHHNFANHGHPDNEESNVHFDGKNAVMMMLVGDSAAEQLGNARAVVERLQEKGLQRITPDFIDSEIANPQGALRRNVAQIYGPVTGAEGVRQQTDRFKACDIIGPNGKPVNVEPVINENFAIGMRPPVKEEVYLLNHTGRVPAYILGDDYYAALNKVEAASRVMLRGHETADEKLDGAFLWSTNIVLSVDAASGKTKPIRFETARTIFDLSKMTVLTVDGDSKVANQYLPQGPGVTPPEPANDKV